MEPVRFPAPAPGALWALAALSLACAGAPAGPDRTVLAGGSSLTTVIAPLNVAAVMPDELAAFAPYVWQELEIYLEDQGRKLKTVSYEAARGLWLRSIQDARAEHGARAGFDDAARLFVGKLSEYAEFEAVILPSLYVGKAEISGETATWDGVERALEVEGGPPVRSATRPLYGVAPAASLHVVVLDAGGNKIHEAKGGLELLVFVRAKGRRATWTNGGEYEFATRTDLFANRAHVREGISRALAPFLPPLPLPVSGGADAD